MKDQANDQINIENVPTFTFKLSELPQITPAGVPELFPGSMRSSRSKRKPGTITNLSDIRKNTVSQLLQVFRPAEQIKQDQFMIKKRLVTNAIDAIYQLKKESQIKNPEKKKQVKQSRSIYKTPPRRKLKNELEQSTDIGKRSQSQSRVNYKRHEQKFKEQQKQKLRRKSGYLK